MDQDRRNAAQKKLDRAFYRVFSGVGDESAAELVVEYLNSNYGPGLRRDENRRVDPHATLAAVGAAEVVADIMRRTKNGRLA